MCFLIVASMNTAVDVVFHGKLRFAPGRRINGG